MIFKFTTKITKITQYNSKTTAKLIREKIKSKLKRLQQRKEIAIVNNKIKKALT